jgi:4-hydroxybenzoate polyprenyltransferase
LALLSDCATIAPGRDHAWTLIHALRLHNWLKNVLVFAPVVLAKALSPGTFCTLFLTWLAFGYAASAQYLLNDFVDKNRDRHDAVKRKRPQAAGELPVVPAAGIALALIVGAALCAASLPAGSQLALGLYLVLCLAYSLLLKRVLIFDVLTLVAVHDLRLVAGACAASIPLSPPLFLVGSFIFLALALIKRDAQLTAATAENSGSVAGRPYLSKHLPILRTLAAAAIMASLIAGAILIYGLMDRAARPEALWFILPLLAAWLCRCLFLAVRGTLNEDLVMFVCMDRYSLVTAAALVLLLVVAE